MRNVKKSEKTKKIYVRYKFVAAVVVLISLLVASLISLNRQIAPVARSIAAYQCKSRFVQLMQAAVIENLKTLPAQYDDLYTIQYDKAGAIQSVSANTRLLNTLQYELEGKVNEALASSANTPIQIPVGTLSGLQLLAGRGPAVAVRAMPLSVVESRTESDFISVGINQSKLQVNLVFSVQMKSILANTSTGIQVESKVCIAEILIVGEIPQVYMEG